MSDQTAATSQPNQRLAGLQQSPLPVHSALLLRAPTALGLAMPVIGGATLGWWEQNSFTFFSAALVILGAVSGTFSIHLLWEYWDRRALRNEHPPTGQLSVAPYGPYVGAALASTSLGTLGLAFGAVAIGCGLLLAWLSGWPMLFFSLMSYGIALLYAAPPIRYGYRGWGMGELGIFVSFGLLATAGGYYALTQELTWTVVAAAAPLGLMAVLVVFNGGLLDYRRDWLIRKRTLAVSFGLTRGLDVSAVLAVVVYGAFVFSAGFGYLPLWTLLSLAGLPLALGAYSDIWRSNRSAKDLRALYATTLNAAIVTGVLFCLALWLDKAL